jgi:hypothetical protein
MYRVTRIQDLAGTHNSCFAPPTPQSRRAASLYGSITNSFFVLPMQQKKKT